MGYGNIYVDMAPAAKEEFYVRYSSIFTKTFKPALQRLWQNLVREEVEELRTTGSVPLVPVQESQEWG